MNEKHLIVFGDHAEQQIKNHLSKIKSYKEAKWLYDGILYQEEDPDEDIVSVIFKDPHFAPDAIIDNNKWLVPKLFANNEKIWQEAVTQCFKMVSRDQIHCYSYVE